MPSSITHFLFAKSVLNNLKQSLPFINGDDYQNIVFVGAQGPDPLFFYGQIPFLKRPRKKEIQQVGSFLHDHKMDQKFIDMIDYANNQEGNQRNVLFSYIFGAMLHYCLDRVAHPFVFYRSGFKINEDDQTNYEVHHAMYESYIDTLMQLNFGTKFKSKKVVKANKTMMSLVSVMYAENEKLDRRDFYVAWKDMCMCEKILNDRMGIKRFILKKLHKDSSLQYAMIQPRKNDLKIDFLNLNRKEYLNPQSLEKHEHSFVELFNIALNDSKNVVKIIKKAYNKEDVGEDIVNFCKKITYSGTLEGSKMQKFESVFLNNK